MCTHSVSMLARASMCTAQHYQLLFRQSQLINRRAEMHLNWFIWLVLDVLFLGGDNLCLSARGLSLRVHVCVCWLTVLKVKLWKYLPNKWIYFTHTNRFFISAGSIVFCSGEVSGDIAFFFFASAALYSISSTIWIQYECHKVAAKRKS